MSLNDGSHQHSNSVWDDQYNGYQRAYQQPHLPGTHGGNIYQTPTAYNPGFNAAPGADYNEPVQMHTSYGYQQQPQQPPMQPQQQQPQPLPQPQQLLQQQQYYALPSAIQRPPPQQLQQQLGALNAVPMLPPAAAAHVSNQGKNESDKRAVNTVWVGRLTRSTTEVSLRKFFCEFTNYITSIHLKSGERKGDQYAFVNFSSLFAARSAQEQLNGKPLDDCRAVMLRINEQLDQEHFQRLHAGREPNGALASNGGIGGGIGGIGGGIGGIGGAHTAATNAYGISNWDQLNGGGGGSAGYPYLPSGAAGAGGLSNGFPSPVGGGGLPPNNASIPRNEMLGVQRRGAERIPREGVPATIWVGGLRPDCSRAEVEQFFVLYLRAISEIRVGRSKSALAAFAWVEFKTEPDAITCYRRVACSGPRDFNGREVSWMIYLARNTPSSYMWPPGAGASHPYQSGLFEQAIDNLTHGPLFGSDPFGADSVHPVNGHLGDNGASVPAALLHGAAVGQQVSEEYVWIGSLPANVEKDDIYAALGEFAEQAVDVRVRTNKKKRTCYAFVDFQTPDLARRAYGACRSRMVRGESVTWKLTSDDKTAIMADPSVAVNGLPGSSPALLARFPAAPGTGSLTPGRMRAAQRGSGAVGALPLQAESSDFEGFLAEQLMQQHHQHQRNLLQSPPQRFASDAWRQMPQQQQQQQQQQPQSLSMSGNYRFGGGGGGGFGGYSADSGSSAGAASAMPGAQGGTYPYDGFANSGSAGFPLAMTPVNSGVAAGAAGTQALPPLMPLTSPAAAARIGLPTPQPQPQATSQFPRPNVGVIGQQPVRPPGAVGQVVNTQGTLSPVVVHQNSIAAASALAVLSSPSVSSASAAAGDVVGIGSQSATHKNLVKEFMTRSVKRRTFGQVIGETAVPRKDMFSACVQTTEEEFEFAKQHFCSGHANPPVTFHFDDGSAIISSEQPEILADVGVAISYEISSKTTVVNDDEFKWWGGVDSESGNTELNQMLVKMDLKDKVVFRHLETEDSKGVVAVGFSASVIAANAMLTNLRSSAISAEQWRLEVLCHVRPLLKDMLCRQYKLHVIGYHRESPAIWMTAEDPVLLAQVSRALTTLLSISIQRGSCSVERALLPSARALLAFDKLSAALLLEVVDDDSADAAAEVQCRVAGDNADAVRRGLELLGTPPVEQLVPCPAAEQRQLVSLADIAQLYAVTARFDEEREAFVLRGLVQEDIERAAKAVEAMMLGKSVTVLAASQEQCNWVHQCGDKPVVKDTILRVEANAATVNLIASGRYIEVHGLRKDVEFCEQEFNRLLEDITVRQGDITVDHRLLGYLEELYLKPNCNENVLYELENQSAVLNNIPSVLPEREITNGANSDYVIRMIGPSADVFQQWLAIKGVLSQHQHLLELTTSQAQAYQRIEYAVRDELDVRCKTASDLILSKSNDDKHTLRISALSRPALTDHIAAVNRLIQEASVVQHSIKLSLLVTQLFAMYPTALSTVRNALCKVELGPPAQWNVGTLDLSGEVPGVNACVNEIGAMLPQLYGGFCVVSVTPMLHPLVESILTSLRAHNESRFRSIVRVVPQNEAQLHGIADFKVSHLPTTDLAQYSSEFAMQIPFTPIEIYIEALSFYEQDATDAVVAMADPVQQLSTASFNVTPEVGQRLRQLLSEPHYSAACARLSCAFDLLVGNLVVLAVATTHAVTEAKNDLLQLLSGPAVPGGAAPPPPRAMLSGVQYASPTSYPGGSAMTAGADPAAAGLSSAMAAISFDAATSGATAGGGGAPYVHLVAVEDDKLVSQQLYQQQWSSLVTAAQQSRLILEPVHDEQTLLKQVKISGGDGRAVKQLTDLITQRMDTIRKDIQEIRVAVNPLCLPALLTEQVQERLLVLCRENTMECCYSLSPEQYMSMATSTMESRRDQPLSLFANPRKLAGFGGLQHGMPAFQITVRCFRANAENCVDAIVRYLDSTVEERHSTLAVAETSHYHLNLIAASLFVDIDQAEAGYLASSADQAVDTNVVLRGYPERLNTLATQWQGILWQMQQHQQQQQQQQHQQQQQQ